MVWSDIVAGSAFCGDPQMVFRRSALPSSAVERSGERSTLSAWLGRGRKLSEEVIQDRCAEYSLSSQGSTPAKVVASRPARLQHRSALFEYTITTATPHSPVGLIAKIHRHARVSEDPNLCVMAAIEDGRPEWRQLSNAYPYFFGAGQRSGNGQTDCLHRALSRPFGRKRRPAANLRRSSAPVVRT